MEEISAAKIREIHDGIIGRNGVDCRILSEAGLNQLVFRANLTADTVQKAAFILYSLSAYPVFREGNTETAIDLCEQVLAAGGIRLRNRRAEMTRLTDGILSFMTEPEDIEQWLYQNVEKAGSS